MIHPLIVNTNYVKYTEYQSERLVSGIVTRKLIPETNEYYYELSVKYRYDYEDDFIIEGAPMDCITGIENHKVKCKISLQFYEVIKRYTDDLQKLISINKITSPRSGVDRVSLGCDQKEMVIPLQKGFLTQTIFTDIQGTMIPWHELCDTYIRMIPYIHIRHIYIGNFSYLVMSLVKATVLYFGPWIKQAGAIVPKNPKYQLEYTGLLKSNYISHEEYNNELLCAIQPEIKHYPVRYCQIPLCYNYGSSTDKILNDFLIEGPECIITASSFNGYLDITIPNTDFIRDLYQACSHILSKMKKEVKMNRFKLEDPETTGFPLPYDIPIPVKLPEKTVFVDTQGHLVSRDHLQKAKIIPLFHIRGLHIHEGRLALFKLTLENAIVLS
jgi:hypothetical protein